MLLVGVDGAFAVGVEVGASWQVRPAHGARDADFGLEFCVCGHIEWA